MNAINTKLQVEKDGFAIVENIYTDAEIQKLLEIIANTDMSGNTFRKSANLFAIRQFLKEIPEVSPVLFNDSLKQLIKNLFDDDYFVVKSIYFDKPGESNWFVAYHQDLTISVDTKRETEGYGPWTVKQNQFAVQPPLEILENIFTIRIHLDETNKDNGALKVIPQSHSKKIYRAETIDWSVESEIICEVPRGGIMLMKPLLLHSSNKTTNNNTRRVIHIEFSNKKLSKGLQWSEKLNVF